MESAIVYLLDTNIWLERLLGQEQSEVVGQLLSELPTSKMLMSDFTFHSIGVILGRLKKMEVFDKFVQDVLLDGEVRLASIVPSAMRKVSSRMDEYQLDFDDAYQCVVAEQEQVRIVSFDRDFNKTPQGRLTPEDVLAEIAGE